MNSIIARFSTCRCVAAFKYQVKQHPIHEVCVTKEREFTEKVLNQGLFLISEMQLTYLYRILPRYITPHAGFSPRITHLIFVPAVNFIGSIIFLFIFHKELFCCRFAKLCSFLFHGLCDFSLYCNDGK